MRTSADVVVLYTQAAGITIALDGAGRTGTLTAADGSASAVTDRPAGGDSRRLEDNRDDDLDVGLADTGAYLVKVYGIG